MDSEPLVKEQVEAWVPLLYRLNQTYPVKAAFWCKSYTYGKWDLFVVSERVDTEGSGNGYGEMIRAATELRVRDAELDTMRLRLIGADDPAARAVLEVQEIDQGRGRPRYRNDQFSDDPIYIYPSPLPLPAPRNEAPATIL